MNFKIGDVVISKQDFIMGIKFITKSKKYKILDINKENNTIQILADNDTKSWLLMRRFNLDYSFKQKIKFVKSLLK